MFNKFFLILCFFSLSGLNAFSQDDYLYEDNEDKIDTIRFFIGANLSAYFANKETAKIYSGSPSVTNFGIEFILNNEINRRNVFDPFFNNNPYSIVDYPLESRYQTAFNLGLHAGYQFWKNQSVYAELNAVQLDYEQLFVIGVVDPFNQTISPLTFEQFGIFGKETRFNFNLGTQVSYYNESGTNAYFSFFGNVNAVRMEENYIFIANRQFDIYHPVNNDIFVRPSGIGYGGGAGTGLKFNISENLFADIFYQFTHTKINFNEQFQPFATQHGFGLRVLWH